jgi:hypothetical protein
MIRAKTSSIERLIMNGSSKVHKNQLNIQTVVKNHFYDTLEILFGYLKNIEQQVTHSIGAKEILSELEER